MPKPLFVAIKNNNYDTVAKLLGDLETPIDVNALGNLEDGLIEEDIAALPLHLSVYLRQENITKLLLKKGADPNLEDDMGQTALERLLKRGTHPDTVDVQCRLIQSLCSAGAAISEEMLDEAIHNCREYFVAKNQPLYNSSKKIAETLYQQYIFSQFFYAVRSNDLKKVKAYLDTEHTLKDEVSGLIIVSFRINPNQNDEYGNVILLAATLPTPDMLKLLCQHKIELTVTDQQGFNILHYAARYGRVENIEWILNKLKSQKVNVSSLLNQRDGIDQNTPLHLSAKHKKFAATEKLLDWQADPKVQNRQEVIAEQMCSDPAICRLFKELYKEGRPSLLWQCAKKLALKYDEPDTQEAIAKQPEATRSIISPLIFLAKHGQLPPEKISDSPKEKSKEGSSAKPKKLKRKEPY